MSLELVASRQKLAEMSERRDDLLRSETRPASSWRGLISRLPGKGT